MAAVERKSRSINKKHSCPSGLRGPSQERLSRDAWVRTPPDAFLFRKKKEKEGQEKRSRKKERGCSSDGRAFASHARGKGIDTPHLHNLFLKVISSDIKEEKKSNRKKETQSEVKEKAKEKYS